MYKLLVPHERMESWKLTSIRGLAKHEHLYTRIFGGTETDEIEHWLNTEFESPAQVALCKAVDGKRMCSDDWSTLVRFLAAQDVRTPASYHSMMTRMQTTLPALLDETLNDSVQALISAKREGIKLETIPHPHGDLFPTRVTTEIIPGAAEGKIQVHAIAGRGLWLFGLKQSLTSTIDVLHKHKWTVLTAPPGMTWLTTDNPVVKLNAYNLHRYDFNGGWGSIGTEIFMPISPTQLLYTVVGSRPPVRGSIVPMETACRLQRIIIEHAHRYVFGAAPDQEVSRIRPRCVNLESFRAERAQWESWHENQVQAEQNLFSD